jgi:hypothetical protein
MVEMLFQRCHAMEQPVPRVLTKFHWVPSGQEVSQKFSSQNFFSMSAVQSKAAAKPNTSLLPSCADFVAEVGCQRQRTVIPSFWCESAAGTVDDGTA